MAKHLITIILLAFSIQVVAQQPPNTYQKFSNAIAENDSVGCIQYGNILVQTARHPYILYKLAECYCQVDSLQNSLLLLEELARMGLSYQITENSKLAKIKTNKRFAPVLTQFQVNQKKANNSRQAFELGDARLIPEGITATSDGKRFFIGSLAKNKIVEFQITGVEKDLAASNQDGLWSVVGMKVSPDNKTIWVCSASEKDTLNGYSGLFSFDLENGKLKEKHILDNKEGTHFFNDLVITKSGEIYFTDSKGGKVLHLSRQAKTIIPLVADNFIYPNGIALDENNACVYVADFTGITRISLQDLESHQVDTKGKTYLNGIDGLYFYKNTLIAIQNSGNSDDRIVRFYLDKTGRQIAKTEVLQSFHPDFNIPTTGVIVNDEFYYIANSQLRSLQSDGTLLQAESLKKPLIKKIKLQ